MPREREIDVVRPGAHAEQADAFGDQRPCRCIGRDRAEHDVGMTADIFGGGLHADVDALLQRAVIERRRPGVVVDDERAPRMRDRGDRGDVRHFERLRARRLDQHRPGVRLEQRLDAGADQGIEIGGLDAIAGQQAVAEIPRRPVDVVADQKMIAGFQDRQQRRADRRQAGRRQPDAGALRAFERHQHVLQRPRGRRPVAAILDTRRDGRAGRPRSDKARWSHGRPAD